MFCNMKCLLCKGCVQTKCKQGFHGSSCDFPCSPHCRKLQCSVCTCEVCNVTSGSCTNGCDLGFYGSRCEYACPENCRKLERKKPVCDIITGFCLNGCKPGFYGDACNITCVDRCKASQCTSLNGTCAKGCKDGHSGNICNSSEANGWDHDEIAGAVGGGFIVILWAIVIVVLICVIWRRRLKSLDVFKKNVPLGEQIYKGSNGRPLRPSCSELTAIQDCITRDTYKTNGRQSTRSEGQAFEMQSPLLRVCSNAGTPNCFTFSGHKFSAQFSSDYLLYMTDESSDQHMSPTRRASSDGGLSEMTTIWKPTKFAYDKP